MKYCKWCPYKPDSCDGYTACQEYIDCPTLEKYRDYKDAAEFEARVALELLRPVRVGDDNSPCIYGNSDLCTYDCPHWTRSCNDNRLLWARLRAEEEMKS